MAALYGRHSSAPVSNGSRPPVDKIVFSGLDFFPPSSLEAKGKEKKKRKKEKKKRKRKLSSLPLQKQPRPRRRKERKTDKLFQSKN